MPNLVQENKQQQQKPEKLLEEKAFMIQNFIKAGFRLYSEVKRQIFPILSNFICNNIFYYYKNIPAFVKA